MATNYCNCDLNNLNLSIKDIVISKVPLVYHGYDSARRLELDLLSYIDDFKLDWGTIHHCKLHVDEKAATAVIFLRFCNPDVHGRVIAEMNGIEWPAKSQNTLRFEFNRKYTKLHQAKNRERLINRNAQTKTEPMHSQPKIDKVLCDVATQTEPFLAATTQAVPTQAASTLAAHTLIEMDLIDLNYDDYNDKFTPIKAAQSIPSTLSCLDFLSSEFTPKPDVSPILASEFIAKHVLEVNMTINKIKLEADKIKKNPLDDIVSIAEFKRMLEEGDKEAWTRNDWDNMIGLKEVFDNDGSVLGYSRSESTEYVEIEEVNKKEEKLDVFSESSSIILIN